MRISRPADCSIVTVIVQAIRGLSTRRSEIRNTPVILTVFGFILHPVASVAGLPAATSRTSGCLSDQCFSRWRIVWLLLDCLIIAPTLLFRPVMAASESADTFLIGQANVAFFVGAIPASECRR
jgi:hypothetical protein